MRTSERGQETLPAGVMRCPRSGELYRPMTDIGCGRCAECRERAYMALEQAEQISVLIRFGAYNGRRVPDMPTEHAGPEDGASSYPWEKGN